ncbi:MAG TPA: ATP-binding protein [Candidatus Limnocylindria bacterium]|nr:ATP-binding protein [Candidatus Limnocylindria bacterium]
MGRFPRSLRLYVAASSIYAALVFLAVHAVYGVELGRAGVQLASLDAVLSSIDLVSFLFWIGISLIAAVVLYRLAIALEGARDEGAQRQGELASIFALGQALSGSLELDEIAERFLAAALSSTDPTVTAALYVDDETIDGYRLVLERGPGAGRLGESQYSASAVPAPIRTRVVDHRQSLVLSDTHASEAWAALAAGLRDANAVRSFAALPLVSHDRLVGMVLFASDRAGAITADGLQLIALVTQFVAASVRTALSLREAQRRGDREVIVNRVAQRARASLDPDEVVRATVRELAGALHVRRVIAAIGSRPDDLRVAYEWHAPDLPPLGVGSTDLPAARQAALTGRTSVSHDEWSRIATPIVVGGETAGVLSLHDEIARDWTIDEVRLVEAVAREMRAAIEAARLFQSRQRENERLLALQRASTVLAARATTRDVIDEVLRTASSLLGQASASLYLWDESTGALRLAQNADPAARAVSAVLEPGHGAGDLLRRLEPVVVNEYAQWTGATKLGIEAGCTALLAVPLVRSGQLLGAIVLRSYDGRTRFTLDDARLLALFGDQAVTALTNAEAFDRQRRAMEELEKVNRAKSEFVSIVSHEFRTPLTGIQGFSEMMRDEDLSPTEMKEYAADINKDAQRLNRLINDMLDLSRMEAGRMTLDRRPTDVNAIVSEVADRIRPAAPQHPITLELDPSLPRVAADHDRLIQVVSNLLSNAVKYSPTGGDVVVSTKREADGVHLRVRDHGMGIPQESLERIWEEFSRVESRETKGIQGTGLGLPIVRQIVSMHGGRVWAESEVGRGSTFHVHLPLAATGEAVEA